MTEAFQDPRAFYEKTMPDAHEAVRTFYTALTGQDRTMLLSCLTEDFTFKSPLAEFDTPEGYAEMVGRFGGWVESDQIIAADDRVVHTFTYHMTEPGKADIPICEVFHLEGDKIRSSRAYNDSADFPQPEAC